jgi:hypothetical protein
MRALLAGEKRKISGDIIESLENSPLALSKDLNGMVLFCDQAAHGQKL